MMLSLKELRTFMAVARYMSFTRASRELNLTQPAVSWHIASLEKSLGIKLFERTGRSIVLTDAGRVLAASGEQIFLQLSQLEQQITDLRNLKGGTIKLGASKIVGVYIMPKLLTAFREEFPEIDLQLGVHSSHTILQQLEDNAYDLAIVAEGTPIISKNIGYKVVGVDRMIVVAAPTHPLAQYDGEIDGAMLRHESFILAGPLTASSSSVREQIARLGLTLSSRIEMDDAGAIKHAVEEGAGLAIISRSVVARELRDGRLVELRVAGWNPTRNILMLWRQDRGFSKNTEAFIRFLHRKLLDKNNAGEFLPEVSEEGTAKEAD